MRQNTTFSAHSFSRLLLLSFVGIAELGGCSSHEDSDGMAEPPLQLALQRGSMDLRITVRDGEKPVMTDLWLYSLQGDKLVPFTNFQDPPSKRRSRRRMLPCTIGGMPSGLTPCDDGAENGLLNDSIRETRVGTTLTSAIDGQVEVALTTAPAEPLVVVAALEDQRYSGAAAIDGNGQPVTLPEGLFMPQHHTPRSYSRDIAPLLQTRCVGCHSDSGPAHDFPLTSYEAVVSNDFGYAEEKANCAAMHPTDDAMREACEQAITKVEYMIELGVPALSPLARRTVPDAERAASAEGLKWYGAAGKRFGGHGDRRMPPLNLSADSADDVAGPTHFDENPADYQILFDWIAQGAPR